MTFKDYLLIGAAVVICCVTWRGCQDGKARTGERTTLQDSIRISERRADSLERISEVYRHEIKHLYTLREQLLQQKDSLITAYKAKPPRARIAVLAQISPKIVNLGDTAAYVPIVAVDSINVLRDHLIIANKGLLVADSIILVQEGKISNDSALIAEKTSQAVKWKSIAVSEGKRADRSFWKGLGLGAAIGVLVRSLF